MKAKNIKTWISVFLLIIIEQGIKVVINSNFLDKRIPILSPLLYFEPMFNRDYSWFNSMLKLGASRWLHVALVAALSLFIYLLYRYLSKQLVNSTIINSMFAFLFSGAVCSLIDKVFWNGSLDYIAIEGLFTFDLKDVYINIFNGLLILSVLLGNKAMKQIEDEEMLKGFVKSIFHKLKP